MDNFFTRYKVDDRSYAAFVKRQIHINAIAAKFNEVDVGKIDIIVSEMTSNLVKHARDGEILYRITANENTPVCEMLSIDKGPGIADINKALRDGVSSTNTLGGGLGAMSRLSTLFQIFSPRQWGTILYSKISPDNKNWVPSKTGPEADIKAVCVPKLLEEVCGDGYCVVQTPSYTKILFGDGLGHGPNAKEAVDVAKKVFSECDYTDPTDIIRHIHEHVRRTRGLVACVAVLDKKNHTWSICGVGNISTRVYSGIEYRNYMSYNGTIGLNIPKSMNPTKVDLDRNQTLIMCTDGIQTRWNINQYPSINKYDATIVAGAILKDFNRGTDDASVLIAKVI